MFIKDADATSNLLDGNSWAEDSHSPSHLIFDLPFACHNANREIVECIQWRDLLMFALSYVLQKSPNLWFGGWGGSELVLSITIAWSSGPISLGTMAQNLESGGWRGDTLGDHSQTGSPKPHPPFANSPMTPKKCWGHRLEDEAGWRGTPAVLDKPIQTTSQKGKKI